MRGEHRLERLRHLVSRLEQLPESDERDRVLGEVRARAVDVDTGVTPRAMLPVEPTHPPRAHAVPQPAPKKADRARRPPTWAQPPRRALGPVTLTHLIDLRADEQRLCLEDAPAPHAPAPGEHAHRAWERGLRG